MCAFIVYSYILRQTVMPFSHSIKRTSLHCMSHPHNDRQPDHTPLTTPTRESLLTEDSSAVSWLMVICIDPIWSMTSAGNAFAGHRGDHQIMIDHHLMAVFYLPMWPLSPVCP